MKTFLHIGMSSLPNGHAVGLKKYFESIGWKYIDINTGNPELNRVIQEYAVSYKPDLTWIQIQDRGITKYSIQALKNNGSYIIQWCGDKRHRTPDCYFEYCQMGVDLTTFSNMEDIQNVSGCGYDASWLQIGYDENIYNTTGPIDHQADIVFMGSNFTHFPLSGLRRDMVNELKRTYGDRFKAYGSGQPDGSFMGNQHGEAAVYRGAKIGINLSHFDSPRYTSDRMFRMLGCGVCVLSHGFQNMDDDFKNVLGWCDLDQLKTMIDYLLNEEEIRKRVAADNHQLALNNHTFYHMGRDIHELYKKYTDGNA